MCDSHVIYVDTYCTSVDRKAPSQYHFCMHDLYTTREGETQQQERSIWVKTAVVVGSFRKGSDWIRPLIHTPPAVWGFHFCFSSAAILERDAHSSSHCPPSSMENWSRAIYGMSGPISMFSNSFFFFSFVPLPSSLEYSLSRVDGLIRFHMQYVSGVVRVSQELTKNMGLWASCLFILCINYNPGVLRLLRYKDELLYNMWSQSSQSNIYLRVHHRKWKQHVKT